MHTQNNKQLRGSKWSACFTILLLFANFIASGQVLSGKILDEQEQAVPYATIYIAETRQGTISNSNGDFSFNLPLGTYHFTVRSMGYEKKEQAIRLQADSLFMPVKLQVKSFRLEEVKVFPGDEDPAYFIMRKAIAKAPYYRKKIKHYSADLYIKSNFSFNNIPNLISKQEVEDGRKFKDYFKENVTYVIESQNRITYDYPDSYKQQVIRKKSSLTGFDEPPVMGLMTASFYDERPNNVISPLSALALKHYKFTYEGFIKSGDFDVFKIRVTPKRKSDELVEGFIYIVDRIWCLYNIDINSSFEFFNYHIKQQFENLGDNNWLPVSHHITGDFGLFGLRGNFYYGTSVKYDSITNNNFGKPTIDDINENKDFAEEIGNDRGEKEIKLANKLNRLNAKEKLNNTDVKKLTRLNRKILKEQYKDSTVIAPKSDSYKFSEQKDSLQTTIVWDTVRSIPLTQAELNSYRMADSLELQQKVVPADTLESKQNTKRFFGSLLLGDYYLSVDSAIRISYDGLLSLENFDYNAVDGYKYQQGFRFRFSPDSTKRIFLNPKLGYAFNRKALFGRFYIRFSNFLAPGNQLRLSAGKESSDFKPDVYGISPAVNAISSWFFGENYKRFYEREFMQLSIAQNLTKKLKINLQTGYYHFFPLQNNSSFLLSDKKEFEPNLPAKFAADDPALAEQKSFTYAIGLNISSHQHRPWLQQSPFLFIDDFYEIDLSFKHGVPDIFSSTADFSRINLSIQQQANLSPGAGINWQLNAGHYFNARQLHFSQFKHFSTAEIPVSTRAFTHRFQLINDYMLSTNDSYLNVMTELKMEYLLLRYLSVFNKRTWSESIHLNYITTPQVNNYCEIGYSLNNLFFAGNLGVFAGFSQGSFNSLQFKLSISTSD